MAVSRDEAKQIVVSSLPPGVGDYYDLNGDIGRLLYALGGSFKQYGFDPVEALRLELNPATATVKVADWEALFRISYSKTAIYGTATQRRNMIVGYLRSLGEGFSLPGLRAIFQMFLQYADPATISIIETDRALLTVAHTMSETPALVIGANTTVTRTFDKVDVTKVSPAGARMILSFIGTMNNVSFQLVGPDGFSKSWPAGYITGVAALESWYFYAKEFAGHEVRGTWTLKITTGADAITYQQGYILVEGLGREPGFGGDGLGAAMFEWAVAADPALVGADVDYDGARQIIPRIKHAHTRGFVIKKTGIMGVGSCVVPEVPEAIPDWCIAC